MKREHTKFIVDLMHSAQEHIQWPKIRFGESDGTTIQLSVAGPNSNWPGAIYITNGIGYMKPGNKFYGKIATDGRLIQSKKCRDFDMRVVEEHLSHFASDPSGYAKLYGKATGNCMFCAKALTDPQSVAVGYGPICAAHYNLPHGNMDVEVANELSTMELDFNDIEIKVDPAKPNADQTVTMPQDWQNAYYAMVSEFTKLQDKVQQLEKQVYEMQTKGW